MPSNSPGDRQPGRQVHFILQRRYEVVSHLGQGGMGTVYMARDLRLANRFCVVKKLRDDFFREEDKQKALEFFNREAMVLSPLKHPNIVSITDYFDEAENYYLVMEYVEGENLHQMLSARGEPFAEEQVLQWARQIADVLNFLHSNDPKVIYRDLKPSNVMIDTKDRVKLVDFGIARPYAEDSDNTHVVSAGYSPPEQYWGAADPRSDIYALGATMHYLLTGQEPLALQTCFPRKTNPNVSERTDQVVQRATAQDVWLRYQSAAEMLEDLASAPVKTPFKAVQVAAIVVGMTLVLGFAGVVGSKFVMGEHSETVKKELADEKQENEQLKLQIEFDRQNKNRDLENLRKYQTRDKQSAKVADVVPFIPTPKPNDTATTTTPTPATDAPTAPSKSPKAGVAFRETDEAQLTDPEGLAPLEEDSGHSPLQFFGKPN
jgi:serine/threonine protein kinase